MSPMCWEYILAHLGFISFCIAVLDGHLSACLHTENSATYCWSYSVNRTTGFCSTSRVDFNGMCHMVTLTHNYPKADYKIDLFLGDANECSSADPVLRLGSLAYQDKRHYSMKSASVQQSAQQEDPWTRKNDVAKKSCCTKRTVRKR
ncbi:hypothetical protein EV421DRAFT_507518 [Armillaria borealis]|uniref:Secreted protein n=1 Tax=Armillaria borealis TaxID=47425 RepID=A0AA39MDH0_9AGAR|nr:hypothetical protein EV421DRAFT_507518 [Armillaria borealis]